MIDCFTWNAVTSCWTCLNVDLATVSGGQHCALPTGKHKNDKLRTDGRTLTFIMRRESESASLLTQNTAEWVYRQGQKYVGFVCPVRRRSVRVSIRFGLISKWRNKENICMGLVHTLLWFSQTRESLCISVYVRLSVRYTVYIKIICFRIGDFGGNLLGL